MYVHVVIHVVILCSYIKFSKMNQNIFSCGFNYRSHYESQFLIICLVLSCCYYLIFIHLADACVEEGSNGCGSFVIQAACRALKITGQTVPSFC